MHLPRPDPKRAIELALECFSLILRVILKLL